MKLIVYEEDLKTIKKEVIAHKVQISFGTIRKFMGLFKIKDFDDTSTVLHVVASSWDEIIKLLDKIFPDMNEDDWNGVKMNELLVTITEVLKFAFGEMLSIPVDQKN